MNSFFRGHDGPVAREGVREVAQDEVEERRHHRHERRRVVRPLELGVERVVVLLDGLQVVRVARREQHRLYTRLLGAADLGVQAADLTHLAVQIDFAGDGDLVVHGAFQQARQDADGDGGAGAWAVLGRAAVGAVHVQADAVGLGRLAQRV